MVEKSKEKTLKKSSSNAVLKNNGPFFLAVLFIKSTTKLKSLPSVFLPQKK